MDVADRRDAEVETTGATANDRDFTNSDAHVENVCQVLLPRLYACVRCEWRKKRPCDAKKLSRKSRKQRKKEDRVAGCGA